MSKMKALVCRECGKEYPTKAIHVCEMCFGPLEVTYNYEEIKKTISRKKIADGPHSMWRYLDLLPVEGTNFVGPHAGFTPLVRAKNLGAYLGLDPILQRSRRRCGSHARARARIRNGGLRVDRQLGELRRRARGIRQSPLLRLHPRRP